jgi:HAD superfamily hydrolase (TIGR01509 family)
VIRHAILFDFDGVLIESEAASNRQIATFLTDAGHPTTAEQSMAMFMGLAAEDFHAAIERWVAGPLPAGFIEARRAEDERLMVEGLAAVAGAVAFVRALPAELPVAVVSSSRRRWLHAHLAHLGLAERFGAHVYSGREDVSRGKPAPDLYLHAADQLGVPIADCAIIEDSPVGATGAVASGAFVVGLCAASHCAPGHDARLRALGVQAVAGSFAEVAAVLGVEVNGI